jgi:DNA ligase 1
VNAPLFNDLASTSERLRTTRARLEKERILIELLQGLPRERVAAAVGWLAEQPVCGPLGVGPTHLWELTRSPAAAEPSLTLEDVEGELARAKAGGREETIARVSGLVERMTERERRLFVGALTGTLRQGSLAGVMLKALARVASRDEAEVRRVTMLTGSIVRAAEALLGPGNESTPVRLTLFQPIAPMLASSAESIAEAFDGLEGVGEGQVEWKVDGVRAQVHKDGPRVAVFSRQGNDITAGCAGLVPSFAALPVESAVLDGEVVLVGNDGRPRPFSDSFSAVSSARASRPGDRLRAYLFDCLHRDGDDLFDRPLSERAVALGAIVPEELRMTSMRTAGAADAEAFYAGALAAGHEGVVVKDVASPYRFGARGRAWQKVKEFSTVDLVVLAAEWGSGRRKGFLSNLHLGARRADGTFCMVGKTFKGLTDALLAWQTVRLKGIAESREPAASSEARERGRTPDDWVVHMRPELVVEIRFNDVQRSPRYPGGVALRFARVVRYREDKKAEEADLLESLVARLPEEDRAAVAREVERRERTARGKRQLSLFEE